MAEPVSLFMLISMEHKYDREPTLPAMLMFQESSSIPALLNPNAILALALVASPTH